jgi:tetratricopeptide (TPR) repeat protein
MPLASLFLCACSGMLGLFGSLPAFPGEPQREAIAHYQNAVRSFQKQEFAKAVEECQRATSIWSRFPDAYDLWGTALLNLGDLDAAEARFKEALAHDPEYFRSRGNLSFTYYRQQKHKLAAQQARAVLSVVPADPLANLVAGLVAYHYRKPQEAVQYLEKAGEIVTRSPEALIVMARLYLLHNKRSAGLEFVQSLAALPTLSSADQFELGRVYSEYGLQDDAANVFNQLAQQFPSSYEARYNLALAYYLGEKIEDASQVLQLSVSRHSRPETYDLLGACYEALGKTPDAAKAYEKAIELDPLNEDYYLRWGELAMKVMAHEAAIKNLLVALQRLPMSYRIRLHLGRVYQAHGDIAEAEKTLRAAIAINKQYAMSWALLAMLFQSDGRFAEALRTVQAGISENPSDYLLPYVHALILWRSPEKEEPLRQGMETLLTKSIAANPEFVESRYLLGRLYFEKGEKRKSLRELEKARELNRSHYATNLLLYREYRQSGAAEKAALVAQDLKHHKAGQSHRQKNPLDESILFPANDTP